MIVADQVFGGLLWFGLLYSIYALDAVYAHMSRACVWYGSGGKTNDKKLRKVMGSELTDTQIASHTWYGKLSMPKWLPSTGLMLVLAFIGTTALAYASWRVWRVDASHEDVFGILFFSFNLGAVLLTAVFGLLFFEARSVLLGVVAIAVKLLLAAGSTVFVALLTWNPTHALLDDKITAFIATGVYALYVLFELIVYGAIYAAQDDDEEVYATL